MHRLVRGTSDWSIGGVLQTVVGYFAGSVCESSSDGYHSTPSLKGCETGSDDHGMYAIATCQYCGDTFKCYSSDLSDTYDKYTENVQTTLGTTVLDSDGYLYWQPAVTSVTLKFLNTSGGGIGGAEYVYPVTPPTSIFDVTSSFDGSIYTFIGTYQDSGSQNCFPRITVNFSDSAPITGYYTDFNYLAATFSGLDSSANPFTRSSFEELPANPTKTYYAAGSSYSSSRMVTIGARFDDYFRVSYFETNILRPQVRIQPFSGLVDITTGDWSVDSRVGSIVGDYGIVGDNGTIIKSNTQYIINETNNTYTNPATGETTPITNWTYDYSDRSYTCVTDSGNTTTITYGDEHVTIQEGDTIYNVYYITDGSGGGGGDTPGPDHKHSYTSTVTTEATCTTAGVKTFTCSCGDTYTEKIPSTGHTWVVKETVNTVYGENGELITQGYTIYRCSVCGEEYKSTDGTAPPSGGGDDGKSIWERLGDLIGSLGEGILGLVEAVVGKILDALTSLIDMINEKLVKVVESVLGVFDVIPSLFGGFLDFLGAVFPFIPEELMNIIILGLAAVIFIGIIKAIRR